MKAGARPLVLIVDDFQDSREMLAEYLELSGFDVAVAATGQEAIDIADSLVPDVVLMDVSLPDICGWDATVAIKSNPRAAHARFVMVTGHSAPEMQDRAKELGCHAFLSKPFLPEVLVARIREILPVAKK